MKSSKVVITCHWWTVMLNIFLNTFEHCCVSFFIERQYSILFSCQVKTVNTYPPSPPTNLKKLNYTINSTRLRISSSCPC